MSEPAAIQPASPPVLGKFNSAMTAGLDRLPPHSPEAERGVLGCILLDPANANNIIAECVEKISVEAFYDHRHQRIYELVLDIYDAGKQIDLITLHQALKDSHDLDNCGGIGYLSSLSDEVPSSANLPVYLEILCDKATLRRLLSLCTQTVVDVYEKASQPRALVEAHERDVMALLTGESRAQLSISDAVKAAILQIESFHKQSGVNGLLTGLAHLDSLICGLQKQDMIVLAGRPSTGKTSLAMQIVENVAVNSHVPVGVFSLEMSTQSLVLRMLCSRSKVDSQRLKRGVVYEGDFPKLCTASTKISTAPIYINDSAGLTITQLRSKARRMHQLHGIQLLVIDYLQLLGAGRRAENRQQEMANISSSIKGLAKELDIPVLVLSQLNRESEKTGGRKSAPRKPRTSDLRDSGAIEQDADQIWLLSREGEDTSSCVPINLEVAKHRNGACDDVKLTFIKTYTVFETVQKPEKELEL